MLVTAVFKSMSWIQLLLKVICCCCLKWNYLNYAVQREIVLEYLGLSTLTQLLHFCKIINKSDLSSLTETKQIKLIFYWSTFQNLYFFFFLLYWIITSFFFWHKYPYFKYRTWILLPPQVLPHTSLPLLKCEQTSDPSLGLLPQTKMEIAEVWETIHSISIPNCPEWRSTDIERGHSGHFLKRLPTIRVRRTNILWFPSQTGGGKNTKKTQSSVSTSHIINLD